MEIVKLAEKLAKVGASIKEIEKVKAETAEYTHLRAADVMNAIRGELFSQGIVIIQQAIRSVERSQPYLDVSDNVIDEVRVIVAYSITDGLETLQGEGVGVGQDYRGKALYKALTGSLKYFLTTLGLIAGTEDDAETVNEGRIPDGLAEKLDELEKKFGPDMREHPITQRDVRAWGAACVQAGLRNGARENFLKERFGVEKISDLKRKDFPEAMEWTRALTPTLA